MSHNSKKNILTYTGISMNPLDPRPEELLIEDIAHALAMICRANGHFHSMHFVAQHCIECKEEAEARGLSPRLQMFCFLHDAAEAYLGDFVSPVKHQIPEYNELEDRLLSMVYQKYAGSCPDEEEQAVVKEIDHTLLYYEFLALMGQPVGPHPGIDLASSPVFEEKDWRTVEKEYLEVFRNLQKKL